MTLSLNGHDSPTPPPPPLSPPPLSPPPPPPPRWDKDLPLDRDDHKDDPSYSSGKSVRGRKPKKGGKQGNTNKRRRVDSRVQQFNRGEFIVGNYLGYGRCGTVPIRSRVSRGKGCPEAW